MGVYSWNNMGNLRDDCVRNTKADLIVLAGDNCYNEGDWDERRTDGYMQAFQDTIANVPWMPIVGNHEFYAGTKLSRYLDSTWEKWEPLPMEGRDEALAAAAAGGHTSATSALGAFLSAGNHHGPATAAGGSSGGVASNTSRYFSADFGLVHLVALSLNGYNGVDTCTAECNAAQVAWLKEDLAAVNRTATPWVVAMSHFPLYLSQLGDTEEERTPLSQMPWMVAEECEYEGHSRSCVPKGWRPDLRNNLTLGDARGDLEPIFDQFGVDIYWAGHIHFYQTFDGPLRGGNCTQYCGKDLKGCKLCIAQPYSYTRMTAYNATDLFVGPPPAPASVRHRVGCLLLRGSKCVLARSPRDGGRRARLVIPSTIPKDEETRGQWWHIVADPAPGGTARDAEEWPLEPATGYDWFTLQHAVRTLGPARRGEQDLLWEAARRLHAAAAAGVVRPRWGCGAAGSAAAAPAADPGTCGWD
eukprot:gene23602-25632_t